MVVRFRAKAGFNESLCLGNELVAGGKCDILDGVGWGVLELCHGINNSSGADRDGSPAIGFDLGSRHLS